MIPHTTEKIIGLESLVKLPHLVFPCLVLVRLESSFLMHVSRVTFSLNEFSSIQIYFSNLFQTALIIPISVVWKLMTKDKLNVRAKFTVCNSIFHHKSSTSTSNLLRHLQMHHPMDLKKSRKTKNNPAKPMKMENRRKESKPTRC